MRVALGLGSNAPDAYAHLTTALARLAETLGPLRVGGLYRTAPIVRPTSDPALRDQPDFLNTAAVADLSCDAWTPDRLLITAKALERAAGRCRGPRDGPRPLDVDLLLWGDTRRADPADASASWLALPHPALAQRRFALAPLADVAPTWSMPSTGRTVAAHLAALPAAADDRVELLAWRTDRPIPDVTFVAIGATT
ncbi:MAG: 2-amino-4-hydroxy-6-hydroxymethyldihydropteridine diphosphokinase [Acidobacteriota bacterium]